MWMLFLPSVGRAPSAPSTYVSYGERHVAVFHEGHAAASMVVRADAPVVDEERLGAAGDGVGGLVQNHFSSSQAVILFAEGCLHQAVIVVPVLVLVLVLLSWYNQVGSDALASNDP